MITKKHKGILIPAGYKETKWWTLCGTWGYLTYGSWQGVDCKRCLKKRGN